MFAAIGSTTVLGVSSAADENLITAAMNNNLEDAKEALARGASPNAVNKNTGFTALMFAAGLGNAEIVRLLIQAKPDLNIQTSEGITALHLAIKNKKIAIARLLLAAGANPDIKGDYMKETPLSVACYNDDAESITLLLAAKANPDIANQQDDTPLLQAAYANRLACAKLLVAAKANLNYQNRYSKLTALNSAINKKHTEMVKILKAAGAKEAPSLSAASAPAAPKGPVRQKTNHKIFEDFMTKCVSEYGSKNELNCEKWGVCIFNDMQRESQPSCYSTTECSNLLTTVTNKIVSGCRGGLRRSGGGFGEAQRAAELLASDMYAPRIHETMKRWGSSAGGCTWSKGQGVYLCK